MKTLIKNARILTMINGQDLFEGDIVVEGARIAYIGPSQTHQDQFDRVIDAGGNVIMPGFKNAHTHSPMTFLRSFADDLPLKEWLYQAVFPLEAKLTPHDVYVLAKVAFAEYLTSGITADFDMYYHPDQVARASVDVGFRTVCLGTVNDFKESVALMKDHYRLINAMDPLVSYRMGFHAEYTTSEEILKELAKAAHELKTPIFTHISETELEVKGCLERHGTTPPMYFERLGLFDYGGGGFHCVHLTQEDLDLFKRRGLYAVTCPGSNTKLGSGIAPIQTMIDMGINLAIGTDGPASNNCLDMFKEMTLTFALQKTKLSDATAANPYKILEMATVGGARAMGLTDSDVLAVGKYADLIMIDLRQPNMQPLNNIVKNIIYSGSKSNVKLTMVAGKVLYEDGRFHLDQPIEQIYEEAQAITDRIKG
ncbi:MAG: amidohydrolase [Bacilli bacterium]|jgi:5-methylthioadenosine/S-adenosylhomocysteine deaminase